MEPLIVQAYSSTTYGGLMFGITTSTPLVLTIAQIESFKKQKHKAMIIINLSIKDKISPYVMGIQEPKDIWEVLEKLFKTKDFSWRMLTWNKLTNLKIDEATSIEDFIVNIIKKINQLVSFREVIVENVLIEMVFNVLPSSFDQFV